MKKSKNYTFKISMDGKTVKVVRTHSLRKFSTHLRTINWQKSPLKVYLRVSYGQKKCIDGCVCTFYNDGSYENEADLLFAFDAFRKQD